jgi:hypothetical protein
VTLEELEEGEDEPVRHRLADTMTRDGARELLRFMEQRLRAAASNRGPARREGEPVVNQRTKYEVLAQAWIDVAAAVAYQGGVSVPEPMLPAIALRGRQ